MAETWTQALKEENTLLVAEWKIYRNIPRKFNREIEEPVYRAEYNWGNEIRPTSMASWLGHVERIDRQTDDGAAQRAYLGQPKGERPVGRPIYRSKDWATKDLKELNTPQ